MASDVSNELPVSSSPSIGGRIALSIALLAGFYLTTLLVVALLLIPGPFLFWAENVRQMRGVHVPALELTVIFAATWLPAAALARGLFVRPPRFEPPGRELDASTAPELFAILADLAQQAGTRPPARVYLGATPDLGVMERGGVLGLGSERVLVLGAPLLEMLTVQELKAGLAHELGHYLGGDTRLGGIVGYTHALFRSVVAHSSRDRPPGGIYSLVGTQVSRFLGRFVVERYARLYLTLTRPLERQAEIAADVLSARLAGGRAAIRALERISLIAPLYEVYLTEHVVHALEHGAMPVDVLPGFERYRKRVHERGVTEKLVAVIREQKTDPFDSHPALTERVHALEAQPEVVTTEDDRPAIALVGDRRAFDVWLAKATRELFSVPHRVENLPWAEVPSRAYAPSMTDRARQLVERLRAGYPEATSAPTMLRRVCFGLMQGQGDEMAVYLAPAIAKWPSRRAELSSNVVATVLVALFVGALLERGAEIDPSLGEPSLVVHILGVRVEPHEIVAAAMRDDAGVSVLRGWAEQLCAEPAAA